MHSEYTDSAATHLGARARLLKGRCTVSTQTVLQHTLGQKEYTDVAAACDEHRPAGLERAALPYAAVHLP